MISMQHADEASWKRLTRGDVEVEDTVPIRVIVGSTCIGTDVRAPELQESIEETAGDAIARIADGEHPGSILSGALLRLFWMGYAHGEAAER